ncbi:MAG: acyl carrier protein [Oscillospiraceae bacterium]|nr:acyl carrier protein [Oscillospiraceae bacterium]
MKEKIAEIIMGLHPEIDLEANTTLIDDAVLDSFDIVTILGALSGEFGVSIPANEIVPENFNSLEALTALVERLSK